MKLNRAILTSLFVSGVCFGSQPVNVPRSGHWRAWLVIESQEPGGESRELPFDLELITEGRRPLDRGHRLQSNEEKLSAWIVNGSERISVPQVSFVDGELNLSIDYYDSTIRAQLSGGGKRLDGEWRKQGRGKSITTMAFHALYGHSDRFTQADNARIKLNTSMQKVAGRWTVQFEKSDDPAIGLFHSNSDGVTTGTFMTTTGDYRYLAGDFDGERLRLSCFDGAHAFLFQARLLKDGSLTGDFWSRDSWHEKWTAYRNENAKLPDAFLQTKWDENVSLGDISFPYVEGQPHTLMEKSFKGHARILVVFGTWCPNCHDASDYLVELHKRYHKLGLSIVGLAFELTGNTKRDARQVKKYVKKHGIEYPVLIAGVADKKKAGDALPFLDKLRSYPTTIFLSGDGKVRAVHTGFTGPATGQAYRDLRIKFESIIEQLLSE